MALSASATMSCYQLQLTGGKAFPTEVAKASNGMPFGLPERGAPELLALLTFIAGFTLLSDAIVGVAFGGVACGQEVRIHNTLM